MSMFPEGVDKEEATMALFQNETGIKISWSKREIEGGIGAQLAKKLNPEAEMEVDFATIELPVNLLISLTSAAALGVISARQAGLDVAMIRDDVEGDAITHCQELFNDQHDAEMSLTTAMLASLWINMQGQAREKETMESDFMAELDALPMTDAGASDDR